MPAREEILVKKQIYESLGFPFEGGEDEGEGVKIALTLFKLAVLWVIIKSGSFLLASAM